MSKKRALGRSALVLCAAVAGVVAALACTGDGAPASSLTSTPPPPTATPAPADPELGHFYRRNGQYDEAVAVFQAVVERSPEPARRQARLSLALTYLDTRSFEEALDEVDSFLKSGPAPAEAARAHFLRARVLAALDRPVDAAREYVRYEDTAGPAAPYAALGRAEALILSGRPLEAVTELEQALLADLPPATHARALLMAGQSLEQAGDPGAARPWYERLYRESASSADQALALWRLAQLDRSAGDPSWTEAAAEIVEDYPATGPAIDALEALEDAGEAVDGYRAGLVLYRHFRDREAVAVLKANLESDEPSHPGESLFYQAAAWERLGDEDAALEAYRLSLERYGGSPLAADAAWWRARLLETDGRLDQALAGYTELALRYEGSSWAPEARFRRGLIFFKQQRFQQAVETWESAMTARQPPEERARTLLWLAKAETELGDETAAREHLEELAALPEAGYFALRAAALLEDGAPEEALTTIETPSPDWVAADAWAASLTPWTEVPFDPTLHPRWPRAWELLAVGLYDDAQAELDALLTEAGVSPGRLYALARAFDAAGQTHLAARAATLLLYDVSPVMAAAAPLDIWRLAYPADFASLVETTARREGVSSALLLAVIRQESLFDPRAGSVAGALGLLQIIPSTGEDIAQDLGVADEFEREDLLRPYVSVRFGARYLKRQIQAFDGAVPEALAAYNGGPTNARRWHAAAGGDVDLFLEEIDLSETRAYLKLVSEGLARYQELYFSD